MTLAENVSVGWLNENCSLVVTFDGGEGIKIYWEGFIQEGEIFSGMTVDFIYGE